MRFPAALCLLLSLALTGCAISNTASPSPEPGVAMAGKVHGGQQPIVGSHVHLLAASTKGYGNGTGSIANPSSSLLTSSTGFSDSLGYYVPTGSDGGFSITGDYTCTPGTQVYLYTTGGNAGAGANAAVGLMAILGACPTAGTFPSSTFVWINEVSTIAAAYAFAGFASDPSHIGSSGTALAQTGIANAFANAANLASLSTGAALATTPAGNGIVPQATINTLANILAACVNSNGTVGGPTNATPCYTLFYNAFPLSPGVTIVYTAEDTASAAISIAQNPGNNVAALYNLPAPTVAFAPALTTQPNDFTLGITFTGGGLVPYSVPRSIAVDASGDVWTANADESVSEFSSLGVALSPAAGYTGGGLETPSNVAIDTSGNAWIANSNAALSEFSRAGVPLSPAAGYTGGGQGVSISTAIDGSGNIWLANIPNGSGGSVGKYSAAGVALSPSTGYTGGGLNQPRLLAIDGSGNVWIPNEATPYSVSRFSSAGSPVTSTGYTGGGLDGPDATAIDSSGNVWIANSGANGISEFSNNGAPLSPSTGFTGGGLSQPDDIAIDGAGNVWTANNAGNSVSKFSSAGTALSPSTGYAGSAALMYPGRLAIDGSGDVWVVNGSLLQQTTNATIVELIGAATPVITPLCAGLPATPTANGTSNLGTRP